MMSTNLKDLSHLLNLRDYVRLQIARLDNLPSAQANLEANRKLLDQVKAWDAALGRAVERLEDEPDVADMLRLKEMDPGRELGEAVGGLCS